MDDPSDSLTFSWRDTARAVFGQCMGCIPATSSSSPSHRPGFHVNDELEGLLLDSESDVDALSLHSNFGRGRSRRSRKKKKGIKLFGFDLFGRRNAEESTPGDAEQSSAISPDPRPSNHSSSTLDSDPSPLSDSRLAELSARFQAPLSDAELRAEEEALRIEEEKDAKKRMRSQARKLRAGMMGAGLDPEAYEAQYGAGNGGYMPHPQMHSCYEDFGPFEHAAPPPELGIPLPRDDDEDSDAEAADLGAALYIPTSRRPKNGSRASASGSDSRSNSYARTSDTLAPTPTTAEFEGVDFDFTPPPPAQRKTRKKKSSKSKSAKSSATTESVASPLEQSPLGTRMQVEVYDPESGVKEGETNGMPIGTEATFNTFTKN